jgi:hypothetical protein
LLGQISARQRPCADRGGADDHENSQKKPESHEQLTACGPLGAMLNGAADRSRYGKGVRMVLQSQKLFVALCAVTLAGLVGVMAFGTHCQSYDDGSSDDSVTEDYPEEAPSVALDDSSR